MEDFPLYILITKKLFPVKKLRRFFICLEIVEAQHDKLNLFKSRVYENKKYLLLINM